MHDILNAAGGIQGLSHVLVDLPDSKREKTIKMIQQASTELVEEIEGQRQLLRAERGNLLLSLTKISTSVIIDKQLTLYTSHLTTRKKNLILSPETVDVVVQTDASLIGRVIGNMIKNALEASKRDGIVTVSCKKQGDKYIEFSVHNQTFIPKNDQLNIFQRSFSTKGIGRGIGTYCMKLLSENYLHGKIRFESSEKKGTTFYVTIPASFPESVKGE